MIGNEVGSAIGSPQTFVVIYAQDKINGSVDRG
jgi:hypothetical protein